MLPQGSACPEPRESAQPSPRPFCPAALPSEDTTPCPDAPQPPKPAAEPPGRGVAGTEGCLSLPVPGRWPIDGGGVSRLGTGPGSKCPCPCWNLRIPGSTPGPHWPRHRPPAAAPGAGKGRPRGRVCGFYLLPRREIVGMMWAGRALAGHRGSFDLQQNSVLEGTKIQPPSVDRSPGSLAESE